MLQRTIMIMIFTVSCFVVQASDKKQPQEFIDCVRQLEYTTKMYSRAITQEETRALGVILNNTMNRCINLNPAQEFAAPKVSIIIKIPRTSRTMADSATPDSCN
jgi:hypothetical protein